MRSVILVGHGDGCLGMKQSAESILGEQSNLTAISLGMSEGMESYVSRLEKTISEQEQFGFNEWLILSDIKGGTPSNVATLVAKNSSIIHVVSGYHLAMILTACTNETILPDDLIQETTQMIQKII
ncbi:PTS sugar transporter subunit IIA [Enterococcus gilvus]|uniref:PTS EIIA type-4 domain-containing protein n=1 Tax=Enterococcus gilvus ATCC BAA-350 TaxID=1158614 RepID=R2XQL6_9ENTE|nr:hypothetical protein [Enterococcus gilvus]EOI57174.1 hypothetical protein UKC_01388 [Enterococcus gilvus ATCC BAA-350]EOW83252.1 hypothetical protein I592_02579 [Enterococcus gilvus ATCC BAA-350]MBS5820084.1 hypothetical protein [Enterococcus gilvus]